MQRRAPTYREDPSRFHLTAVKESAGKADPQINEDMKRPSAAGATSRSERSSQLLRCKPTSSFMLSGHF